MIKDILARLEAEQVGIGDKERTDLDKIILILEELDRRLQAVENHTHRII